MRTTTNLSLSLTLTAVIVAVLCGGCSALESPFTPPVTDCVEIAEQIDYPSVPIGGYQKVPVKITNNCSFPIDIENARVETAHEDGLVDFAVTTTINGATMEPGMVVTIQVKFAPQEHPATNNESDLGDRRVGWFLAELISHDSAYHDSDVAVFLSGSIEPPPIPIVQLKAWTHVDGEEIDLINAPQPVPLDSKVWLDVSKSTDGDIHGIEGLEIQWAARYDAEPGEELKGQPIFFLMKGDYLAQVESLHCGTFDLSVTVTNMYGASTTATVPVTFLCPEDEE